MRRLFSTIAVCSGLLLALPALSDENEDEDTIYPDDESVPSEKCIRPKMIESTVALDRRNILFYMRGNRVYRNVLPKDCNPLRRYSAISYDSTYGRICDNDHIRVLSAGIGSGWRCGLGKFYPLTQQEYDALMREVLITEELDLEEETEQ
jgi:hypothetical protein